MSSFFFSPWHHTYCKSGKSPPPSLRETLPGTVHGQEKKSEMKEKAILASFKESRKCKHGRERERTLNSCQVSSSNLTLSSKTWNTKHSNPFPFAFFPPIFAIYVLEHTGHKFTTQTTQVQKYIDIYKKKNDTIAHLDNALPTLHSEFKKVIAWILTTDVDIQKLTKIPFQRRKIRFELYTHNHQWGACVGKHRQWILRTKHTNNQCNCRAFCMRSNFCQTV